MLQENVHQELSARFGLCGLRNQIDLLSCDAMVRFNINTLESALFVGLSSEVLSPQQIKGRVVDFGCGRGISTALLASYGADVTGVENNQRSIGQGQELSFFPVGKVMCVDGIEYLKSLSKGSVDLVTASMLGPDTEGTFCAKFLEACQHALHPRGVVLVFTDAGTMSSLQRINPLGNGFVTGGTFVAIRGLNEPQVRQSLTLDFGDERFPDFSKLLMDLDLSAFLEKGITKT